MKRPTSISRLSPLVLSLSLAWSGCAIAATDTPATTTAAKIDQLNAKLAELLEQMKALQGEVQTLKSENQALRSQQSDTQQAVTQTRAAQTQLGSEVKQTSAAVTQMQTQVAQTSEAVQTAAEKPLGKFSLWGYGEAYDMNPVHDRSLAQADLARGVFGIGYAFNDKTRFNSEFEVEHTVASASDVGEFEIEQFYIDHQIQPGLSLQAGLFLIPAGFLNEVHEPTHFYGVQRNFVETLIIPSTWREGGLNLHGDTEGGLRWSVGLTTGQDLSKWNFTPEFVPYKTALELEDNDVAPLQATHQELSMAKAQHLAQYVALDYLGQPGWRVGGTLFTSKVGNVAPGLPDARATLWEGHLRYAANGLQLSALVAQGTISNTASANQQFPGTANPIPAKFNGWFVEAAYKIWEHDGYSLAPFTRYEHYNMGVAYEGLAPGFGPRPSAPFPTGNVPGAFGTYPYANDNVATVGANFYLNPNVVFKVDYQHFNVNTNFSRVDFGLGLSFE